MCSYPCLTCSTNAENCLSCNTSTHVLSGNTCLCSGGGVDTGNGACVLVCGDGIKSFNEECDDNNTINGDGCSSTCIIELNHYCT